MLRHRLQMVPKPIRRSSCPNSTCASAGRRSATTSSTPPGSCSCDLTSRGAEFQTNEDDTLVRSTEMLDLFGEAIEALPISSKPCRCAHASFARGRSAEEAGSPPPTAWDPHRSRTPGRQQAGMSPGGYPDCSMPPWTRPQPWPETMTLRAARPSMGTFMPARPSRVLDLQADRPVPNPSIFDNVTALARGLPGFVQAFRDEIRAPCDPRRSRTHRLASLPRSSRNLSAGSTGRAMTKRLDGVLYPSTKNPNGACVALSLSRAPRSLDQPRIFIAILCCDFRPRSPRRLTVRVSGGWRGEAL